MKYSIQIVGVGGQGVLLASMVLGNAAMEAGYDVAMSEVHGMAQRGGSVRSTLRFGDEVYSPLEETGGADLIMSFEPVETVRALPLGNRDSAVIMNLDPVLPGNVAAGFETYPEIEDLIREVKKENDKKGGIVSWEIEAPEMAENAESAVVRYTVKYGNGSEDSDKQKVVKIDGKWMLDSGK
jgi:indolepyruvate ferredoxin oxidoreductase beta subunit